MKKTIITFCISLLMIQESSNICFELKYYPDECSYSDIVFESLYYSNIMEQKRREGFVEFLTPDIGNGALNIGYGVNVSKGEYLNGISEEEASKLLEITWMKHYRNVSNELPDCSYSQKIALANLSYNCGWNRVRFVGGDKSLGYTKTFKSFKDGDYCLAAEYIMHWCNFGSGDKRRRSENLYKSRLFDKQLILLNI